MLTKNSPYVKYIFLIFLTTNLIGIINGYRQILQQTRTYWIINIIQTTGVREIWRKTDTFAINHA